LKFDFDETYRCLIETVFGGGEVLKERGVKTDFVGKFGLD
jgi:hypothetical protein